MTNPNRNRTTNQTMGHTRSATGRTLPLIASPPRTVAAMARICASAAAELPMIFPVSSALEEMLASRISTMRVCFSSTTELAMPMPKTMAAIIHTMPKPIPRK
jgi:hypothetical protein